MSGYFGINDHNFDEVDTFQEVGVFLRTYRQ